MGDPIRGAAARVVANMEASLGVPTATSFRQVPAKLLEVNRRILNNHLGRTAGGKVSFTHIIGYAVVRAISDSVPAMGSTYTTGRDGAPRVSRHEHVGLGIAVDQARADGSRSLVVVVVRGADTFDFRGFWIAYEDLVRKVRSGALSPDDFAGATVTLTNPGTIGTMQSVPRLMSGQGTIVGVGAIGYPAEYEGADPRTLADLGVSKVITISSTYDHRIIQGAESGLFLKRVHDLLLGSHGFYDSVFASMGVPYEAVEWRRDVNPPDQDRAALHKQMSVDRLVNMHRVRGHLIADLDPLATEAPEMHPELDPASYGLTIWDLDREFLTSGVGGQETMALGDLLHVLRDAYCRTVGVEFMHIQDPAEKGWIQAHVEGAQTTLTSGEQRHILDRLNAAEALERFLSTKYVGQKRFGIEGAESAIPLLDAILTEAADLGMARAIIGMAHRGRLNILVNIVGKTYEQLFEEFEEIIDLDSVQGSGDVKYHLGQTGQFVSRSGSIIDVDLAANPSHLEAVDPVVVGMARARMDQIEPPADYPILPVLIHGDAAFAGQGVVAETLNLSNIKGYRVGGTIHLIINNQLGFTTPPEAARSSEYPTDVAKMVQAPIFHVNGDDPEACVRVARLAFAYRNRWHKDVVIDMFCYRRHGHNEGDDPSYTQPLMYKRIDSLRSTRKLYTERLVRRGDISIDEAETALDDFSNKLQAALDSTRQGEPGAPAVSMTRAPTMDASARVDTGVPGKILDEVFAAMDTRPEGFSAHPKLARQLDARAGLFRDAGEVDWATAESLALGSLLHEGTSVRLSGEDSRRGTFSQRHLVWVDYDTGAEHAPLAAVARHGAHLWMYDSLLSELAVLGFEYGYSVANTEALVIWEAQFGDFANGAQVIIDQFIAAGEDKWAQASGLVMLLPHGLEGQGPEHSSARVERYLALCAGDNMSICNPTTAAQYFHLLRRQMRRPVRKPLVVLTPKSQLRTNQSRSRVQDLTSGSFSVALDDRSVSDEAAASIRRVVLASGKVAIEAMVARGDAGGLDALPVAIVRIEQLYPWPAEGIASILHRYPNAEEICWLQEEPANMGPWSFAEAHLVRAHGGASSIRRVSREESASPATGVHTIHAQEQRALIRAALGLDAGES